MSVLATRPQTLVAAALVLERGCVLLGQRRADQAFPLQWELPGGKLEPGESPEAALAREIREELGCDVEVGTIYEVLFHAYEDFDLLMLVYACRLIGEPEAREVADVAWVPIGELRSIDILPADAPLVERLIEEASQAR